MDQNTEEMNEEMKGKKNAVRKKKIFRHILSLILLIVLLAAVVLEYLTLTEFRPMPTDTSSVDQGNWESLSRGQSLKILTWNCGYGALGDNADYFMDGGSSVRTADKERVRSNLDGIVEASVQTDADVILYQEIDEDSDRSRHIYEMIDMINEFLENDGRSYSSAFAFDQDVRYIPYPLPPVGKIRSGLLSLTGSLTNSAERIQLPCPFKWPVRLISPKRCLLLERLPLKDSPNELVLINLHLDACDGEEGTTEQMEMLMAIMNEEAEKGNYVIAGGDFMRTFSGTDLSAYPVRDGRWAPGTISEEQFGEGWQFLMDAGAPTCRSLDQAYAGADRAQFQYYVTDGFIVSDNVEVISCETKDLGFVCSDHNPVLIECVLK